MSRLFDSSKALEMKTCDCSLSYFTTKIQMTLENVNIDRKKLLDLQYSFDNEFIMKYILSKLIDFYYMQHLSIDSVLNVASLM